MSNFQPQNTSYGLSQAIIVNSPSPIAAKRNPGTGDHLQIGTTWCNITTNAVYILASITNNSANWVLVQNGGGGAAGNFANLTVTPGPIALTGTTTINTAGAAATSIGIAPGTGAVSIGNATGNITTNGNLTMATGNLTLTTGNMQLTAGEITLLGAGQSVTVAASGYLGFNMGASILYGGGDPNGIVGARVGSLYLNSAGSGVADRLWVNTNGVTAWTSVTTAA